MATQVKLDVVPVLNGYCVVAWFDGKEVLRTKPFQNEGDAWTQVKHLKDTAIDKGLANEIDGQSV